MSWFAKTDKLEVQRTLGRILNRTLSVTSQFEVDQDHDQRLESRSPRMTPVLILPLADVEEDSNIRIGLTQDISCQGMSLATLGKLSKAGDYAIAIGRGEDFCVLKCRCVRTCPMGYGYHSSGLQATQVLSAPDFSALKELAEHLETHVPVTELNFLAV